MVPSDGELPRGTLDSRLLTNLRRGALEYCVLALLRQGESYGLDIAHALSADGVLITREGTLYPLLRRLESQGVLESSWSTDASSPRRYYRLSTAGELLYGELRDQDRRAFVRVLQRHLRHFIPVPPANLLQEHVQSMQCHAPLPVR